MGRNLIIIILGGAVGLGLLLLWNTWFAQQVLVTIDGDSQATFLILGIINQIMVPFLCATPPAIGALRTGVSIKSGLLAAVTALIVYLIGSGLPLLNTVTGGIANLPQTISDLLALGIGGYFIITLGIVMILQPILMAWTLAIGRWRIYLGFLILSVYTPILPLFIVYAIVTGGLMALGGDGSPTMGGVDLDPNYINREKDKMKNIEMYDR